MEKLLEQLNWRYAVKQYDQTKTLSPNQLNVLKEAVRMAPSSFGLQPFKVIFIQNPEIRESLKQVSFNQSQITDASCVAVFAIENTIDEAFVDRYFDHLCAIRHQPLEGGLKNHRDSVVASISRKSSEEKKAWATHQAYLALGFLLYTAAQAGIDANPMEGFISSGYDKVLGLTEIGLSSVVIAAIGYRHPEDFFQHLPKVRRPAKELFIEY